jgi:hypothetical protein
MNYFLLVGLVCVLLNPASLWGQTSPPASGSDTGLEEMLQEAFESIQELKGELSELDERRSILVDQINEIEDRLANLPLEQSQVGAAGDLAQGSRKSKDSPETDRETWVKSGLAYTPPLAAEGRNTTLLDEDFPKSVPLFGSDLRFSFGGYAKADIIRDFSGTGDESQFVLATIPVNGNPQPGSYSHYQVRETRFHFDVRNTRDGYPDSRFFLEFDFFEGDNTSNPRLRHGYFQYGKLLVGQTWTTTTELRQLPFILDFAAGDSLLGGRTRQIRWIGDEDGKPWTWSVALESFDDTSIANPYDAEGVARANWPRIVGVVSNPWDGGVITAGLAISELRFDGAESLGDSTRWGYTGTVAGRMYLDDVNEAYLGLGIGYSSGGVTDILTFANGQVPNALLDEHYELQMTEAWNTQIALHWPWTPRWSSNLSYAYARLTSVPMGLDPDLIREGWSVHANLIYRHDERLTAGFEYMYGYRENIDSQDGDADRIQFSLFYYF